MGQPLVGFGITITREDSIGSGTYTGGNIVYVKDVVKVGFSRGTFNKTHHQSSNRWTQLGKALKTAKPVTFSLFNDFSSSTQNTTAGLLHDLTVDDDIYNWKIAFPGGEFITVPAILTDADINNPLAEGRDMNVTLTPAGEPNFSGI